MHMSNWDDTLTLTVYRLTRSTLYRATPTGTGLQVCWSYTHRDNTGRAVDHTQVRTY